MYLTVTHSLGYMLVRSTTKGVQISCGSIQWANSSEIHTPSVEYYGKSCTGGSTECKCIGQLLQF